VRQRVVESDLDADLSRMRDRQFRGKVLIFLVAGAENNDLQVHEQEIFDRLQKNIYALLIRQTGDDADQGRCGFPR
jgi:hypothetical protein